MRPLADFSGEILQTRQEWVDTFKVLIWREKKNTTANQEYCTQKNCPSELEKR